MMLLIMMKAVEKGGISPARTRLSAASAYTCIVCMYVCMYVRGEGYIQCCMYVSNPNLQGLV